MPTTSSTVESSERVTVELAAVRVFTDDVDRLIAFYEQVTGLTSERLHPLFAELTTSRGTLAVASTETVPLLGDGVAEAATNRSVSVDFLVEDVDARYAELSGSGLDLLGEPKTLPWGNRSLLLRDPDGNLVNLFTPTTDAARVRFGLDT